MSHTIFIYYIFPLFNQVKSHWDMEIYFGSPGATNIQMTTEQSNDNIDNKDKNNKEERHDDKTG